MFRICEGSQACTPSSPVFQLLGVIENFVIEAFSFFGTCGFGATAAGGIRRGKRLFRNVAVLACIKAKDDFDALLDV